MMVTLASIIVGLISNKSFLELKLTYLFVLFSAKLKLIKRESAIYGRIRAKVGKFYSFGGFINLSSE
jgi:hypothetical protein